MKESYYFLHEKFTLDANQWGFLIGITGFVLTVIGLLFALYMYKKQRLDQANDAYDLFVEANRVMSEELVIASKQLQLFAHQAKNKNKLKQLSFFSVHISDNFLLKIGTPELVRYFSKDSQKSKLFDSFQIHIYNLGEYALFFTQQINYLEQNYIAFEKEFDVVKLLRSSSVHYSGAPQEVVAQVDQFLADFRLAIANDPELVAIDKDKSILIKDLDRFNTKHIAKLKQQLYPFIEHSEKANHVVLILEQCQNAHDQMQQLKSQAIKLVDKMVANIQQVLELTQKLVK